MKREIIVKQIYAPYDIVLVDIDKSVLDGYEFIFMKKDYDTYSINRIFCSKNDLNKYKVRIGKKYKKGQIVIEWEEEK